MSEEKNLNSAELTAMELVKMFNKIEKSGVGMDSATGIGTNNQNLTLTKTLRKYDTQTVDKWLEQPSRYSKELRDLSLFLLQSNTLYFRAVHYMANMAQICPVLIPNNVMMPPEELKRTYFEVASLIEKLNLQHEFIKVFASLFGEGVFFGLEYESENSFYIKKLNPDFCQITSTNDGAYCYHFKMSFFDKDTTGELLKSYASIWPGFAKAYAQYKKDSKKLWVELPYEQTICMKISEGTDYCIAPFVSAFSDLCHIDDYKNLNKISVEQGNYQLLGLEMETNSKADKANDFTVSTDVVMAFYNMIANGLPDGVGAFVTPVSAKPIKFEKRNDSANQVANATSALFDSLGISPIVFSGANNAGGLKYSVRVDESMVFSIYRQIERWLNRKLKHLDYDYHVRLLDITIFNRNDIQTELLKLAQMSIPVKSHLAASAGLSPLDMLNTSVLETTILEIDSNWKPLMSSHTQSASATDEGGRKEVDDTELSEAGEVTRNQSSNDNREQAL